MACYDYAARGISRTNTVRFRPVRFAWGEDCDVETYTLFVQRVGGPVACPEVAPFTRRIDDGVCRIDTRRSQVRQLVPAPAFCGFGECPPARWSLEACLDEGQHVVFEALGDAVVTFRLYGGRDTDTRDGHEGEEIVLFTTAEGGGVERLREDLREPTLLPFVAPRASVTGSVDPALDWCYRLDVEARGRFDSIELHTGVPDVPDEYMFGLRAP